LDLIIIKKTITYIDTTNSMKSFIDCVCFKLHGKFHKKNIKMRGKGPTPTIRLINPLHN
jgi:multimeric flavodoxin WrbA